MKNQQSEKWLGRLELYGVPGQVRTANLPLRRAKYTYSISIAYH
jgi:hypothetical protein